MKLFIVLAVCIWTVSAQSCPEPDGLYADSRQCDKYIQCDDGVPTEKLCPDGLIFKETYTNRNHPCTYMTSGDCVDRPDLQPALRTENCPRQWGYYDSGDRSQCGYFYNCVNGIGFRINCPEGLAFSSDTLTCVFADESPNCDLEAYLGFTCPPAQNSVQVSLFGLPRYESSRDCRTYFLCVNESPRLQKCDLGHVYNSAITTCDEPENGPAQCRDYYPADQLAEIRRQREERKIAAEARRERLRELYLSRRQARRNGSQ